MSSKKNLNNHFKSLITKYQINNRILENINLVLANSVLNDSVLTISSIALSGGIILDSLKLFKEHVIYYFNNYYEQCTDEEHLKIKKLYDEYVEELSKYLRSDDPINIGINFTKMLWEGDLSYDKFEFNDGDIDRRDSNNIDTLGVSVILGEAVCRHIAALLVDVYKKLGFESEILLVKVYPNNIVNNLKSQFTFPNHAVVLVKKDNKNLIIDPTNALIGVLNKNKKSTKIVYNMLGDIINNKIKISLTIDESIVKDIKEDYLIKSSDNLNISEKDIEKIQPNNNSEFKEKNKELIKSIFDYSNKSK